MTQCSERDKAIIASICSEFNERRKQIASQIAMLKTQYDQVCQDMDLFEYSYERAINKQKVTVDPGS